VNCTVCDIGIGTIASCQSGKKNREYESIILISHYPAVKDTSMTCIIIKMKYIYTSTDVVQNETMGPMEIHVLT